MQIDLLRKIELGTIATSNAALDMLRAEGCKVGDWAEDMLQQPTFTWSISVRTVAVVEVSAKDLGFKSKTSYGEICSALQNNGCALCPPELGPQLRLQYKDQPAEHWIMLAMPPVLDSVGYQSIFFLGRGSGGLWLGASRGHPKVLLNPDVRFAACLP